MANTKMLKLFFFVAFVFGFVRSEDSAPNFLRVSISYRLAVRLVYIKRRSVSIFISFDPMHSQISDIPQYYVKDCDAPIVMCQSNFYRKQDNFVLFPLGFLFYLLVISCSEG